MVRRECGMGSGFESGKENFQMRAEINCDERIHAYVRNNRDKISRWVKYFLTNRQIFSWIEIFQSRCWSPSLWTWSSRGSSTVWWRDGDILHWVTGGDRQERPPTRSRRRWSSPWSPSPCRRSTGPTYWSRSGSAPWRTSTVSGGLSLTRYSLISLCQYFKMTVSYSWNTFTIQHDGFILRNVLK